MPWKEETVMFRKQEFIKLALTKEKSFTQLCDDFNISRETGYKLLKRYQQEGLSCLESRSRAPHHQPTKTSLAMEEKIIAIRIQYPTWGGRKIYAYLKRRRVAHLPAPSTMTEILQRRGYISVEESLKRQALIRFEREQPNELWQIDFKGHFQLATQQRCYPLTILDDHSRFSLGIRACENECFLPTKSQLFRVFKQYGLPEQINVDNGSPWGSSKLFPYTKLAIWLMQLGIRVTHSRPRHPQTNGKLERFHRTFKQDVLHNQTLRNFYQAQKIFDKWRTIYNYERPHEAIDMKVPAAIYHHSKRPMPNSLPLIEYNDDAIVRKARGNGYICYRGKEYLIGKAFCGYPIEVRPHELGEQLELYFGKHKIYTYDLD